MRWQFVLLFVVLGLAPNFTVNRTYAQDTNEPTLIVSFTRERIEQFQAATEEFQNFTTEELTAGLEKAVGLDRVKELPLIDASVVTLNSNLDEELLRDLIDEGFVNYIEAEQTYSVVAQPNDPRFGELWGLNNTGQSGGTPDVDVDGPEAWNLINDAQEVVVGVVDTGIDYTHPDLAANMWVNTGEIPGNARDDDGNGYVDDVYGINAIRNDGDPRDDHYHGTHCAGTIGGRGNDGVGVSGVAWRVKLMGLKFLSSSGSGVTSDAVEAINYAVTMKQRGVNIRVLSNSWGGGGYSQALRDAIAAANAQGIIFVAAAGNSAVNTDVGNYYPANYDVPNVVSVAAVDRTGALASFSNYGATKVHVAAPGVAVVSTAPNNTYRSLSGTSMATPHVSGVAALLFKQRPNLAPVDLRQLLISTSKPLPSLVNKTVSRGIVSAYRALSGDSNFPPAIRSIADQNLNVDAQYLDVGVQATDADSDPLTYSATVLPVNAATAQFTGNSLRLTPQLGFLGDAVVTVVVADPSHLSSINFKLTIHHNSAPVVPPIADQKMRRGGRRTLFTKTSDAEGDRLVASARILPAGAATLFVYTNALIIQANPDYLGNADIEYSVSDPYSTTKRSFRLTIAENGGPIITAPDSVAVRAGTRITVPITVTDPNDDSFLMASQVLPAEAATVVLSSASRIILQVPTGSTTPFLVRLDANDGVITSSRVIQFTLSTNQAPRISPIPQYVVAPGASFFVPYQITDPDGDTPVMSALIDTPHNAPSIGRPTLTPSLSGVQISIGANWKLPFRVTIIAQDATSYAQRSFAVWIREQAQSGIDTDGDGVSDEAELRDGTDRNDRGSHIAPPTRVLCGEWNGFLGGMWNIKELVNRSNAAVKVRTTLYSIEGRARGSETFELAGGSQRDLAVHDFQGWTRNSYGKVCSEMLDGDLGAVDGRMVYYKPGEPGERREFQFAFAMPLQGGISGKQHLLFNTFQPSLDRKDRDNLRVNWIQLTNLDDQIQQGTLVFYNLDGSELGRENVRLAGGARRDFAGHKFGLNRVGLVSWEPEDTDASFQLRNVRYYYDNAFGVEKFAGAFQLEGAIGSGLELSGPLDTVSSSAIVEVANTGDQQTAATVRILAANGNERTILRRMLPAHSSWHIIADEYLSGERGLVKVQGAVSGAIIGTIMQYGRTSSGGISYLYGVQLQEPVAENYRASYNTFLGQSCDLMLVNARHEPINVTLEMSNFNGEHPIPAKSVQIPAEGMLVERVCDLDVANRYGVLSISSDQRGALVGSLIRLGLADQYRFPTPVR